MNLDIEIEAKIDEMQQIKAEVDKLDLMHEFKPGDKLKYNTTEEVLQSGELHIMQEIAYAEFNLLLMRRNPKENDKPLTLQNWINLKRSELDEHRELQKREGLRPTSFKYQP